MWTIILRGSVVLLACAFLACGGDSGGGGGVCMDGQKSMPGMAGDPCPQMGTMCASVGGHAVACCAGSSWALNTMGTVDCKCEQATVPVTCAAGGTAGAMCGNGKIDVGEQCDGAMLGTMGSCMALGMGTGVLKCTTMCKYDTTMCSGGTSTGGTGAGGSGS